MVILQAHVCFFSVPPTPNLHLYVSIETSALLWPQEELPLSTTGAYKDTNTRTRTLTSARMQARAHTEVTDSGLFYLVKSLRGWRKLTERRYWTSWVEQSFHFVCLFVAPQRHADTIHFHILNIGWLLMPGWQTTVTLTKYLLVMSVTVFTEFNRNVRVLFLIGL